MINIDIGLAIIVDENEYGMTDGPYIAVKWKEYAGSDAYEYDPSIGISGCTREHFRQSPEWVRLLSMVKEGRNGIIKLSVVYDLIMHLPKSEEPEYSGCIKIEDWMKFWAEKALIELGDNAYFSYT